MAGEASCERGEKVKYIVDGQKLRPYQKDQLLADGSVEFVDIEFLFSNEWDSMDSLVAQFTQNGKTYNQVIVDGKCKLPAEIQDGPITISVFGYKGAVRGTTAKLPETVYDSGFVSGGETPIPPTPDLYAQLIAEIRSKKTAYEAAVAGGYTGTEEEFNVSMAAVAGIPTLELLNIMHETGLIDPVTDENGALLTAEDGIVFIL